ncbi:hypothetical protein GCM10020258_28540 [Sphingomonas yabuuchiae]
MQGRKGSGFTLIEIMVALAVFSLAAMALVRLESETIRGASILDETVVAQMVARNVAIAAVTDPQAPALGRTTGAEVNGGRSWKWTRIVSGTGDARVVRIDVAVANAGGRITGRMTMVRPHGRAADWGGGVVTCRSRAIRSPAEAGAQLP